MKIYELIILLSFIAVVVDYWRNREEGFIKWLVGGGFLSYMLKICIIFSILVLGIVRIEWSWLVKFLNFKVW